MKNILAFIILVVSYSANTAQNLKGKFMVGGDASYSVSHTHTSDTANSVAQSIPVKEKKTVNLGLRVNAGYFVTNHIVVGIIGSYNRTSFTFKYNNPAAINNYDESGSVSGFYSAGFFSRYYQPIRTSRFSVFCELSLQHGWSKISSWYNIYNGATRDVYEQLNGRVSSYSASLNPGMVYFITNKIGLETSFGSLSFLTSSTKNYASGRQTGTSSGTSAALSFALTTFRFGVNVYFGGKTKVVKEQCGYCKANSDLNSN